MKRKWLVGLLTAVMLVTVFSSLAAAEEYTFNIAKDSHKIAAKHDVIGVFTNTRAGMSPINELVNYEIHAKEAMDPASSAGVVKMWNDYFYFEGKVEFAVQNYGYLDWTISLLTCGTCVYNGNPYNFMCLNMDDRFWLALSTDDYMPLIPSHAVFANRAYQVHSISMDPSIPDWEPHVIHE